jgi:STE24 endopeptidase
VAHLVRKFARWTAARVLRPVAAALTRFASRRLALGLVPEGAGASDQGGQVATAEVALDEQRQRDARRYALIRRMLSLVGLGLDAAVVGALLFTRLGFALRDALAGAGVWRPLAHSAWAPLQVAGYFGVLYGVLFVLGLPLSFYGGYVLAHRFGLSTQNVRGWIVDQLKGLALSLVFSLGAVEVAYALLAVAPQTWWIWAGAAMLVFSVVLANLYPILLLPIFNKLTPLPEGELKERLLALARRARTRVRGVYSMNMSVRTRAANAMLAGLGNTRRIIVGDTLLEHFTPDEIEVVLAHELGHHVHHDVLKLVAEQVVLTFGGLYVVNAVLQTVTGNVRGYHGLADAATLPLLAAAMSVFGLVTMPLGNAFSRWVERQADAYALESTGNVPAFMGAMTRLANQNLAEAEPPAWVEFLLYDHPSIGRRLAFGRRYAAAHGLGPA